jgi:hypothetical protein
MSTSKPSQRTDQQMETDTSQAGEAAQEATSETPETSTDHASDAGGASAELLEYEKMGVRAPQRLRS